MDGAGQDEPRHSEQGAPNLRQRTPDAPSAMVSDVPQPALSPTTAAATESTVTGGFAVTETQTTNLGTAQAASPASQLQTMADTSTQRAPSMPGSDSNAGQGEPADRRQQGWSDTTLQAQPGNSQAPGTGTFESPQLPPPPVQQAPGPPPQQPQQPQHHPHPPPPHPQHHLQPRHPPVPTPAPAPAPPPPAPAPATYSPHGAPHPLPHPQPTPSHHQHPHSLPLPPPPQHQHQHTLRLQQPAPQSHTNTQIPHQYQQQPQHHSHQHHHQHHQHHHQPHHHQPPPLLPSQSQSHVPAPATPVTPVTPLPPLQPPHASQFHSHSQPQPQPVLRSQAPSHHHASLSHKPIIMDPPAARKPGEPSQARGAVGFPSPTRDYATVNPKFVDDCTRMNFAIQQSVPEAVRRIVRDHWEKCLLGSEFHQAFILNASIHHALPSITQRAVRDFGAKMVSESKHELIEHFTAQALDEVADLIIARASDSFLDKCLEKRLLTIEAKPLINALAKAERLGYEPGDIVQDDQHERVIPQEAYPGAGAGAGAAPNGSHVHASQPPPAVPHPSQGQLQCMKCFRTFVHAAACDYHTRFNVCSHLPPTARGFEHSCPHCGQGFTSLDAVQNHLDNKICGNFGPPQKMAQTASHPARNSPAPHPSPAAIIPSASQPRGANGFSATQQSTPVHPRVARAAAATPGSTGSGIAADPYGHLTEEQMQQMTDELHAAEEKYAPRFAEANEIADENLRRMKLEGLRNSFGTKQSMIRKKYGVRLRERRTKAEIQAERERLGLKKAEREKARASTGAQPPSSSPATFGDVASRPAVASGWTAANAPRANAVWEEHDAKRRRTDDSGGYQTPYKTMADETPTRKTLSVAEMGGGLAGSSATAATHDPTLPPPSQPSRVYEQSGARVEIHEPSRTATPTGSERSAANGHNRVPSLDARQPVVIDDESSDDSDEDIPSTLPTHVRKSLASGSNSLLPAP